MNPIRLMILVSFVFAGFSYAADEPKPSSEEGFASMFNGKDLTGWTYGKVKTKEGEPKDNKAGKGYQVRDGGIIYCTKADGGHLFTEKEYDNFVFRFEFKLTESANNGIGIRSELTGDPAYQAMEIQVLDNDGKLYKDKEGKVWLKPAQFHGSIYDVVAAKQGFLKPVGEWNEEEITANKTRITIKLNGTVIVDADLAEIKDPAVLKRHPGLLRTKGRIGFLGHGAEVEFRNLRIKEIK